MRYVPVVTILTLLLIATPSINSAYSSSQQESVISNQGTILVLDNFANTIFFEYGAESGALQPPWDFLTPQSSNSKIYVSSAQARTGNKSIYFWQNPDGSDSSRRSHLREYGVSFQKDEGYFSWWIYIPTAFGTYNEGYTTLGGFQLWWGYAGGVGYQWYFDGRFGTYSPSQRKIYFGIGFGQLDVPFVDPDPLHENWDNLGSWMDYENSWVHLQVYWKIHTTDGAVKAWLNGTLVANKTSIATDPRAYDAWNNPPVGSGPCEWSAWGNGPYPVVTPELYQGTNSPENYFWVDDVVAATEKVPETYRVVDK